MSIQSQYKILQAVITSPREGDQEYDIASTIIQLDLFENIERPFLTGRLLVSDDNATYSGNRFLAFRGNETIRIRLEIFSVSEDNYIKDLEFVMTGMRNVTKANDRTAMILFDLSDPMLYRNYLTKFSRSFTGTPYQIINKIFTDSTLLNTKELSNLREAEDPTQQIMKVVIPYLTPFGAVEWLRDRCTTKNGSPYFLFKTMHGPSIWWMSLDTILSQPSINEKAPFIESNALTNVSQDWLLPEFQTIEKSEFTNQHNTLNLFKKGALAATFTNTDISSSRYTSTDFAASHTLANMTRDNILPTSESGIPLCNVYDDTEQIDGSAIDQSPTMWFHQVNLSNVYGDYNSYYDDNSTSNYASRIKNMALRNFLYENQVKIEVPGYSFMATNSGVGDIVSMVFSSNFSTQDEITNIEDLIDLEKSGDYMVYSLRHSFSVNKISSVVHGCKLARNYRIPS